MISKKTSLETWELEFVNMFQISSDGRMRPAVSTFVNITLHLGIDGLHVGYIMTNTLFVAVHGFVGKIHGLSAIPSHGLSSCFRLKGQSHPFTLADG